MNIANVREMLDRIQGLKTILLKEADKCIERQQFNLSYFEKELEKVLVYHRREMMDILVKDGEQGEVQVNAAMILKLIDVLDCKVNVIAADMYVNDVQCKGDIKNDDCAKCKMKRFCELKLQFEKIKGEVIKK